MNADQIIAALDRAYARAREAREANPHFSSAMCLGVRQVAMELALYLVVRDPFGDDTERVRAWSESKEGNP